WVQAVVREYVYGGHDSHKYIDARVNPTLVAMQIPGWANLVRAHGYAGLLQAARMIFGYQDLANLAEIEWMFETFQHEVGTPDFSGWDSRLHVTNENEVIREFIEAEVPAVVMAIQQKRAVDTFGTVFVVESQFPAK